MADLAVTERVLVATVREMDISRFSAIYQNNFSTFVYRTILGSNHCGANHDAADCGQGKDDLFQ